MFLIYNVNWLYLNPVNLKCKDPLSFLINMNWILFLKINNLKYIPNTTL